MPDTPSQRTVPRQITQAGDSTRRQRLRVLIKLMLLLAASAVLYVLFASFLSGQPDQKNFESKRVDVSAQKVGEMTLFNWYGRPVLILRRSAEQIAALESNIPGLLDPDSDRSEQPVFALNRFRSREPGWFVAIALGTDFSCSIEWLPAAGEDFNGQPWPGGFKDACRGARYDLAGRVYSGQQARKNLAIPQYRLESGDLLVLGAE